MKAIDIVTQYGNKKTGDTLPATSWNAMLSKLQSSINEIITDCNNTPISNFYVNGVLTTPVDGIVWLEADKSYILEGTLCGQIGIPYYTYETGTSANKKSINIILNGVNILTTEGGTVATGITASANTCFAEAQPAIALNAALTKDYPNLIINVNKDTKNNFICTNVAEIADSQAGCIESSAYVSVQGVGYLTCINKGGHGIKADSLRITGPNIYVEASHDAIHGVNLLDLDCGNFYINKANDAFGTGDTGIINIFGGTYYAYHITENVFDGKSGCNVFNKNHTVAGTNVASASQYTHITKVYENPTAYYGTGGTVTQYSAITKNSDGTWSGTGVALSADTNGIYQISQPYVEIKGYINAPINIPSTLTDVTIRLDKAYIVNNSKVIPTIYYQATDSKVKLYSVNDTVNMILNNETGDNSVDIDAVKSENNISVEVKNKSHLIISSLYGDGLDGGDVKVTDSKGVLLCINNGARGIKGSCVIIGPNAETTKSVIISYYTNSSDTENYSTLEGAVVCIDNCVHNSISVGKTATEDAATYYNYGFADVYCRNGKYSKGTFGTYSGCLIGVFICNSIAACVGMDFNASDNIFYNNVVSPGSNGITSDCGKTYSQYLCIPFGKAAIIK